MGRRGGEKGNTLELHPLMKAMLMIKNKYNKQLKPKVEKNKGPLAQEQGATSQEQRLQGPKHAFETAKSMEVAVVGTHAKRQSPSRIPAQPAKDRRPDRGLTYPLNP